MAEAAAQNLFAGLPVTGFKVTLFDGAFHVEDSSPDDFKRAAFNALRVGIPQAVPVLLEPIMKMEIVVPDESMGSVVADLNRKRGAVEGVEARGEVKILTAQVPLAETFGYANELRNISRGKGFFSMFFSHYAPVPAGRLPSDISVRMEKEIRQK